jgi:hypothetical protein
MSQNNLRVNTQIELSRLIGLFLPEFTFFTGDEKTVDIKTPCIHMQWLGESPKRHTPEGRNLMFQLDIYSKPKDTWGLYAAKDSLDKALGFDRSVDRWYEFDEIDYSIEPYQPTLKRILIKDLGRSSMRKQPDLLTRMVTLTYEATTF